MAILVKKIDSSFSDSDKCYAMIANIKYGTNQSDMPQADLYAINRRESMEIEYRVFHSKKARDRCITSGYIMNYNFRNFSGLEPVWDEEVANAYDHIKETYNEYFANSILTPREFYTLDKELNFSGGGNIGVVVHYSEVIYKKEMDDWPTDTSKAGLHSWAYNKIKEGKIGKGAVLTRLHPELLETMEDDFESVEDVLKRMAKIYPELLKIPSADFNLIE